MNKQLSTFSRNRTVSVDGREERFEFVDCFSVAIGIVSVDGRERRSEFIRCVRTRDFIRVNEFTVVSVSLRKLILEFIYKIRVRSLSVYKDTRAKHSCLYRLIKNGHSFRTKQKTETEISHQ